MLYRTVKKTGDKLSILGFGCMRLLEKNGRIDGRRVTRQIRQAVDRGVNLFDTAMPYHFGASEPFLGRALADGYRAKVKLSTKLPSWNVKSREDMDRILQAQLNRLRTDHLDYYFIHALEGLSWERMTALGILDFLDKIKADGRVLRTGFSFHGGFDSFKAIIEEYDWDACMIQYNYLDEFYQAGKEGLKIAAAKGLGVVVMEPLRGGLLGGKVPHAVGSIWKESAVRRSPAEWALRWVWNHPEVTTALSGMNDEAHIEKNIGVAEEAYPESLTEQEQSLVGRAADAYRSLMKAGCTGCRYCLPCPAEIDIPSCFEAYNNLNMFNNARMEKLRHVLRTGGVFNGKPSHASLCKNCGRCVDACPQHLAIPELLKEVADSLEGVSFKSLILFAKGFMAVQRWNALRKARRSEKQCFSHVRAMDSEK